MISDYILRRRCIFTIYFELSIKLQDFYILLKKQIFENFEISHTYKWSVRLSKLRTELEKRSFFVPSGNFARSFPGARGVSTQILAFLWFFAYFIRPLYLFSVGRIHHYYWLLYVCTIIAAWCYFFSLLL